MSVPGVEAPMGGAKDIVLSVPWSLAMTVTTSFTLPSGTVQPGDICIVAYNTSTGGPVNSWLEFNPLVRTNGTTTQTFRYKVLEAADIGVAIGGFSASSWSRVQILVIRAEGAEGFELSSFGFQITSGDPSAQVVASNGVEGPLVVLGYTRTGNGNPSPTWTPVYDGILRTGSPFNGTLSYKLCGDVPGTDYSIDMPDADVGNTLCTGYIRFF